MIAGILQRHWKSYGELGRLSTWLRSLLVCAAVIILSFIFG